MAEKEIWDLLDAQEFERTEAYKKDYRSLLALCSLYFPSFTLRRFQARMVLCLINQRDCFGIAPTGSGKTLIVILAMIMLLRDYGKALIISPLNQLMLAQVGNDVPDKTVTDANLIADARLERSWNQSCRFDSRSSS